jgi:hypothetical protein
MVHGGKCGVSLEKGRKGVILYQVAALKGYEDANAKALTLWEETYSNNLFVALTDTFSTKVFFQVCLPVLTLLSKP